jgi:hypothetical protein
MVLFEPKSWSVVNLQVGLLVGEVRAKPPSHVGDSVVELMLAMAWCLSSRCCQWHDVVVESFWWWRCQELLEMTLPSRHWPRCDVAVESCWWWCCWIDVGCGVLLLSSHAGDGIANSTLVVAWCCYQVMLAMALLRWCWPWHDVIAESCWWWCYQALLVMTLSSRHWLWPLIRKV